MNQIRLCKRHEIPQVMAFIRDHWDKNHVLAWHRKLLEFQHVNPLEPDYCNWIVACDQNEFIGVMGLIDTRCYDNNLGNESSMWIALWKVDDQRAESGLGLKLLKKAEDKAGEVGMAVTGITDSLPPLYQALGYTTGELTQYVLLDANKSNVIASVPEEIDHIEANSGRASLALLSADTLRQAFDAIDAPMRDATWPKKSSNYFHRRYLAHPAYSYQIYQVAIKDLVKGIIVTRRVEHKSSVALRIVDTYVDSVSFAELGLALLSLTRQQNAEYLDLWQFGMDHQDLISAGFRQVNPDGDLIIPNYFEPFIQENARIRFAVKIPCKKQPFVLFRADGDQDRPNRLAA